LEATEEVPGPKLLLAVTVKVKFAAPAHVKGLTFIPIPAEHPGFTLVKVAEVAVALTVCACPPGPAELVSATV
jgi:hypothetical protein